MASVAPLGESVAVGPHRAQSCRSVILFYRYFAPPLSKGGASLRHLEDWHRRVCCEDGLRLRGRIILAEQGINGTLAGPPGAIDAYIREAEAYEEEAPPDGSGGARRLLQGIDWKRSECDLGADHPELFPDLVVQCHKEIVSSGGMPYAFDDRTEELAGGKHLSPEDFHSQLASAKAEDDLVLLDVRNRSEYAVGRFFDGAGREAVHPNMRNFQAFRTFVDERGQELFSGKKVMMYCTGGVRCETASAYLRSTGLAREVCQLQGGIHRYAEEFGADGYFKGKNFVFDRRVAVPVPTLGESPCGSGGCQGAIVGTCSECGAAYDEFVASAVCTVCVCLVLVCPTCRRGGIPIAPGREAPRRREWFCEEHSWLRGAYFTFLDLFDEEELSRQRAHLEQAAEELGLDLRAVGGEDPRQRRLTVTRQLKLLDERLAALRAGASLRDLADPLPCRVCRRGFCDGYCWGFWKGPGEYSRSRVKEAHADAVSTGESCSRSRVKEALADVASTGESQATGSRANGRLQWAAHDELALAVQAYMRRATRRERSASRAAAEPLDACTPQQRREASLAKWRALPLPESWDSAPAPEDARARFSKEARERFNALPPDAEERLGMTRLQRSTELLKAAESGDAARLARVLRAGANVDAADEYGLRALHYAAWHGSAESARLLLHWGADSDCCSNGGSTPLDLAVANGRAGVAAVLDATCGTQQRRLVAPPPRLCPSCLPQVTCLIEPSSSHPGAGSYCIDGAFSDSLLDRLDLVFSRLEPTETLRGHAQRSAQSSRGFYCDAEGWLRAAIAAALERCASAAAEQGLEPWCGGSSALPYMKFRSTEIGCHLAPHVDASKRDATCGGRPTTHSLILYLATCTGGETLLLDRLAPAGPAGSEPGPEGGAADTGVGEAALGVRAAVRPVRGRLLLFPHKCPHAARRVIGGLKLLLRGGSS